MLTTSPKRVVHYVPREIREQGLEKPSFRIRTPTGGQRSGWLDNMKGDETAGMIPTAGSFMNAVVRDCLIGWDGLHYDDPEDPASFGEAVPFDVQRKLDPLSPGLITELFKFIWHGCRLKEDDLVPLESASSSPPASRLSPSTASPARSPSSSGSASGATADPTTPSPSPAHAAADASGADGAEGASLSSSTAAHPST